MVVVAAILPGEDGRFPQSGLSRHRVGFSRHRRLLGLASCHDDDHRLWVGVGLHLLRVQRQHRWSSMNYRCGSFPRRGS
jgi:hypothetical protein